MFQDWRVLVAAALVLLVGWSWIGSKYSAWRRSRTAHRRSARAMRGEQDAEQLLTDCGYEILERQLSHSFTLWCDGEEVSFDLRADLLVSKDDIEYIAEVKTGESAPSLRNAATRRQLLEYTIAYDSPVILLVDVEGRSIQEVCFDEQSES